MIEKNISISQIDSIKEEIRVWAERNFPTTKPEHCLLGIREEVGELCHAILKEYQGIRKEDFVAAKKDAIGDITVYFLDFLNRSQLELPKVGTQTIIPVNTFGDTMIETIDTLYIAASVFTTFKGDMDDLEILITDFILSLYNLCDFLGYDLIEILNTTWNEVKKRDWITYPKNGLTE